MHMSSQCCVCRTACCVRRIGLLLRVLSELHVACRFELLGEPSARLTFSLEATSRLPSSQCSQANPCARPVPGTSSFLLTRGRGAGDDVSTVYDVARSDPNVDMMRGVLRISDTKQGPYAAEPSVLELNLGVPSSDASDAPRARDFIYHHSSLHGALSPDRFVCQVQEESYTQHDVRACFSGICL